MSLFLPHITLYVGQRAPSLGGTITVDGDPLNLGVATVNFKMRERTTNTLKVNTLATVTNAAGGQVRYDWAALDVDTKGVYDAWWHVNPNGPDTPEFMIEVLEHDDVGGEYVSANELAESLSLAPGSHASKDLREAVVSATAVVNSMTGRTFTAGSSSDRYYTPVSSEYLIIDPYTAITAVTYQGTAQVADVDYYLVDNVIRRITTALPRNVARGVKVTGSFGYSSVPPNVRSATKIIAAKLLKRTREAPWAVLTTFDGGGIRLSSFDPDVDELLAPYVVSQMIE